jgi:hypothetical protein
VRVKDLNRNVMLTDDDNLVAVTISVRNLGDEPRPFHSWYEHTFGTAGGADVRVYFADNSGREYPPIRFDDVSHVEGQRWADHIRPDQVVQDTLLFMLPNDVDRGTIQSFRLALPAAAVELTGFFRFDIPVTMIEGLGKEKKPATSFE